LCRSDVKPLEIIVAADGDMPGDAENALAMGCRVIRIPERHGPARARNEAARAASGEIVLFLDSDVVAPPDTIGRIAEILAGDVALAALFGSYDDAPAASGWVSQYKNLLHHYVHQNGRKDAFTFWAGCGAVRRDIFLKLGGFDETYQRPSIEDIHLGYRLRQAGHRVELRKELQVKHLKRWTLSSLLKADIFDRALPWTDLILRHGAVPDDLNLKRSSRVSAILAWGLAVSLACSLWKPRALAVTVVIAAILVVLNRSLYAFFYRKHGFTFVVSATLLHWLYFLYSSGAFAAAAVRHYLRRAFTRVMRVRKTASSLDRA
jgi:glycosyltransferase involved in cell wall biosynthesis